MKKLALFLLLCSNTAWAVPGRCHQISKNPTSSERFERDVKADLDLFGRKYHLPEDRLHNSSQRLQEAIEIKRSQSNPIFQGAAQLSDQEMIRHGVNPRSNTYILQPKEGDLNLPPTVVPDITSKFPYAETLGSILSYNDPQNGSTQYRLFNVGFRQLRRDWPEIRAAIENELKQKGRQNSLILHRDQNSILSELRLLIWRDWVSNAVMNLYALRKDYISAIELIMMGIHDHSPFSDDYLVLSKDNGKSILETDAKQFDDDVLAVVRLVRMEEHSLFLPPGLISNKAEDSHLPLTFRTRDWKAGRLLRQKLLELNFFEGKKIAEISRFVKFDKLPEPVMSSFLKNMFDLAMNDPEPIDIFVISVDKYTRRLFRRDFGFKDLITLTAPGADHEEYVLYLDTSSPEFAKVRAELNSESMSVLQTPNTHRPDPGIWLPPGPSVIPGANLLRNRK